MKIWPDSPNLIDNDLCILAFICGLCIGVIIILTICERIADCYRLHLLRKLNDLNKSIDKEVKNAKSPRRCNID